jgi:N-methylhydantoinase B
MSDSKVSLNVIEIELISNALRSVVDETFVALMKTAYSTNIKERHDHSTCIMDLQGRGIVQASMAIPVHIASMTGLVSFVSNRYGDDVNPGDIFVANDPHVAGGTHLPDINMAAPIFNEGKLVAFFCNIAHHADIGGMAPGSMAGGMREIYQEGLRLPLVRLFHGGELDEDLLDLILLNVRVPRERRGDYLAQVSASRLGERRMKESIEQFGIDKLELAFDEIVAASERRMRRSLADLPDGEYEFEDVMDNDGVETVDINISLKVKKLADRIHFDFSGSHPQVTGNINTTLNATQAGVAFALQALLDPHSPNNEGILNVCEVTAETGSVLNSVEPASVAARAHTCQRVIDVVFGALADCLPQRAMGASNGSNTTAVFAGKDPRNGESYVYLETLGGGCGARATKDGKDGVQVGITNTSNLPVEAIELEYPLLIEEYSLIDGSGGSGKYRGGMGLRRIVRPLHKNCVFNGVGERFVHQPWGVFGGEPGRAGKFYIRDDDGTITPLPTKPNEVLLKDGQCIVVETPGAGGYGVVSERASKLVEKDRVTGKQR